MLFATIAMLVHATSATAAGPEAIVGGFVMHARTGEGMPGAVVVLRSDGVQREAHADDTGTFAFRGVTAGEHSLQVLFGAATMTTRLKFAPGERRIIDLPLDPDHKPTVIDPSFRENARQEGLRIRLRRHSRQPVAPLERGAADARTEDEGR